MSLELILGKPEVNNLKVEIVKSSLVIDDKLQTQIDESWGNFLQEMLYKGRSPWNGKKYRVEKIEKNIVFLSETDFKTNLCLRRIDQMQLRNNAVVVANIMTNGNYLVFGRRKNVGIAEGLIAWIAGGVEPVENSENVLIDTMKIELKEELGLKVNEYDLLLKLVYKSVEQGAYYFYFETYTKLSKAEVLERFNIAEHKEENSELLFYKNIEEGINKLKNEKDMLPEVVEFFNKFYEIKY